MPQSTPHYMMDILGADSIPLESFRLIALSDAGVITEATAAFIRFVDRPNVMGWRLREVKRKRGTDRIVQTYRKPN
jgi:hypothetical protein